MFQKVRILCNRRSGPGRSRLGALLDAVSRSWGAVPDRAWLFPSGKEESDAMVDAAVADGADCILVCGGDGTVSSVGRRLIGTGVPMGVVPLGSGNGLARHFSEALDPEEAIAQLAAGEVRDLDVGTVEGRPFLVSASFAWDAALVQAYDRLPMRGVLSYVLAGAASLLDYEPQPLTLVVDGTERIEVPDPLLCTVGNLSGWGGGALIDPSADADDGRLELVAGRRRDGPAMLAEIADVFSGGSRSLPGVIYRKFSSLRIERAREAPIQLDGELVEAGRALDVSVVRHRLRVLVPASSAPAAPPPSETTDPAPLP